MIVLYGRRLSLDVKLSYAESIYKSSSEEAINYGMYKVNSPTRKNRLTIRSYMASLKRFWNNRRRLFHFIFIIIQVVVYSATLDNIIVQKQ